MDQMKDPELMIRMFDFLPYVNMVIKDIESRFVIGTLEWAQMVGIDHPNEAVGKDDYVYFPKSLSDLYIAEDKTVLAGQGYTNRDWLVPQRRGLIAWCIASKMPIYAKTGKVIGLICELNNFRSAEASDQQNSKMASIIQYIENHFVEDIAISELAAMAHLSLSQFNRKFKEIFHISPSNYILKMRLNNACHDLRHTSKTVSMIAVENGFYDNSYFARQFRKYLMQSPQEYRNNNKDDLKGKDFDDVSFAKVKDK